jgi:ABC-type nitrate/sulfonate/bicarbonate transport system substrate-binding protein
VFVKGKWGSAACAVALTAVTVLAAGCSSSSSSGSTAETVADTLPTNYGAPETTTVTVGAVPAMDSAGFFVAYNEGLFTKEGLHIVYTPAVSSETAGV